MRPLLAVPLVVSLVLLAAQTAAVPAAAEPAGEHRPAPGSVARGLTARTVTLIAGGRVRLASGVKHLADERLTVPAGGSAATTVTADTRLSSAEGAFAGWLTATSGELDIDGGTTNSPYAYRLAWFEEGRKPTGFVRRVRPTDLATVRATYASATPEATGMLSAFAYHENRPVGGFVKDVEFPLPATRTEYYNVERAW